VPNPHKNPWTESELTALEASLPETGMAAYHAFGALCGYSKSYNAYEVKRRRMTDGSPDNHLALPYTNAAQPKRKGVTREEISDYVGFNVGFWDLETTFSTQPIVLFGAIADQFAQVQDFRKGPEIVNDRDLVVAIRDALSEYDIWVTWNGKLFDVPVLNGRLRFWGERPLPKVMHIDAMYGASGGSMRIGRRSLQSVSEYFDVPNRKTPLNVRTWDLAMSGDEAALSPAMCSTT
jgi:uncharacterized protein YprB with RNaseH-like and TPR domain